MYSTKRDTRFNFFLKEMRNIYMGIWRTDKLVTDKLVSDKLVTDKLVSDKLVPDKLTRDNTIKGLLSIIDSIIILEERVKLCNSDIEELTICNANLVKRYNESEVKHKIAEDKLLMIIEELYDKMK
jgi:hypothetical protein